MSAMKTTRPLTLALVASLLALTGCAALQPKPAPTVTVTATTTVTATASATPKSTTLASLDAVRVELIAAGMPCDNWTIIADIAGTCDSLVLVSFSPATDPDRKVMMSAITLSLSAIRASGQPVGLLVGDNWFIRMHKDDAKIVQETMGGIILQ
jgi:hypothetical protein